MLQTQMAQLERWLIESARIPAVSRHPVHKGYPREVFIRDFLSHHLSERAAIGTGEIIDARSKPGEKRPQVDVVVYQRAYPKLTLGAGINAFLAESVVATIEVKSCLTKKELKTAIKSTRAIKRLETSFVGEELHTRLGLAPVLKAPQPPAMRSFVVAYDGPKKMRTVYSWLDSIHSELGIDLPDMPPSYRERVYAPAPSIDGIYVLGKGFVQYDNAPVTPVRDEQRKEHPEYKWFVVDLGEGALAVFFTVLAAILANWPNYILNPNAYLTGLMVKYVFGT